MAIPVLRGEELFHCVFCRLIFIVPSRYFSHRPFSQHCGDVFSVCDSISHCSRPGRPQPAAYGLWMDFPSPCSSAVQQHVLQLRAAHACCKELPCDVANHTRSGSYLLRPVQLALPRGSTSAPSGAPTWPCPDCTSEEHSMQLQARKSQPRCEPQEPSRGLGLPLSSSVAESALQ